MFGIKAQRLDMVVVDGASAHSSSTATDGVSRELPVIVVARKKGEGCHPFGSGLSLPSHIGTRGFVFAPSKGIDALTGVATVVIFKKTARHVGI